MWLSNILFSRVQNYVSCCLLADWQRDYPIFDHPTSDAEVCLIYRRASTGATSAGGARDGGGEDAAQDGLEGGAGGGGPTHPRREEEEQGTAQGVWLLRAP